MRRHQRPDPQHLYRPVRLGTRVAAGWSLSAVCRLEEGAAVTADTLPSRRWVECAKCIEHKSLDDGNTDVQERAADHTRLYMEHDRYRIVSQVGFSLAPAAAP